MKNRRRKLTSLLLVALMLLGMVSGLGAHSHSFDYAASGATVTAKCTDPECGETYTLTLLAPEDLTADGSAKEAAVEGLPLPDDVYHLDYDVSPVAYYTSGGEELEGAPTEPGDYVAQISWGGANAVLSYTLVAPEKDETTKGGLRGTNGMTSIYMDGGTLMLGDQAWTTADKTINSANRPCYPLPEGNYQLMSDIVIDTMIGGTGSITLDLNGYGILMTGNTKVMEIDGGYSNKNTITLNDSNPESAHYITLNNYRGTAVNDTGTESAVTNGSGVVKVCGGYITGGNDSGWGGSICAGRSGNNSFVLNGGTIIGNVATNGGGLRINGNNGTDTHNGPGGFVMTGGAIIYNKSNDAYGGVSFEDNVHFEISGNAVIQHNFNQDGKECNVYFQNGKIIDSIGGLTNGASIGVTMATTTGAFTSGWNSKMGTADPAKYFTSDNTSYDVLLSGNEAAIGVAPVASVTVGVATTPYDNVATAISEWSNAESGATLTLLKDVTTASTITVSGTKTLDLNGYGIRMTGSGSVINVPSGAALNLDDSNTETSHKFTVPADGAAGLAVLDETSGTYTITGGYITGGNTASGSTGGGVTVSDGTFVMNGGTIIGNQNTVGGSGGVYLTHPSGSSTPSFTLNGGAICHNTGANGGGVCVANGSFTMSGGTISGNASSGGSGGNGGGAMFGSGTAFILNGGMITGNTAAYNGGGVYYNSTSFSMSGGVIRDNTAQNGTANNLYLNNYSSNPYGIIAVASEGLASGTSVGVSIGPKTPGTFTSGIPATTAETYKACFSSDNSTYEVHIVESGDDAGQLELYIPPEAQILDSDGATVTSGTFADMLSAWTAGSTLKLLRDVETGKISLSSGEHTLDLGGKTLTRKDTGDDGTIFDIGGGVLTVTDTSSEKTGVITRPGTYTGSGFFVHGSATTLNFVAGKITGLSSRAMIVWQGSTINMSGGEISGNYMTKGDNDIDGLVRTYQNSGTAGGTFNMTGGKIINNTITLSHNKAGAVCVERNGTFKVSGDAEVKDNNVNVYLASGHKITVSDALGENASIGVTMAAPGVFTNSDTTDYNDASLFTSDAADYQVFKNNNGQLQLIPTDTVASVLSGSTETFHASLGSAVSAWNAADGATLTLLKDVTTASTITVSGTKTLDLNGHGIRMTGTDSVITVASGAALTLNDSNPDVEHKFTVSNPASNGAGLAIVDDGLTSGYQTFTGGYITGGKGKNTNNWSNGGGIYLDANATVVMYGGTIIGNGNNHTHGGALRTHGQGSNFTMYGGSLRNNEGLTGGAFRVSGGSVSIYGGSILYNRVSNDHGAISGDGALVLQDCEIRGNFAQTPSGGVMAGSVSSVSGNTVIADNYVGTTPNNLQLATDKVLTITDKLTNTVPIGVTMAAPGVFTSGWKDKMGDNADPSKYFTSDSASYIVGVNPDGELLLGAPCKVTFSTAHGTVPTEQTVAAGAVVNAPDALTEQGWNFIGWYADEAFETAWDFGAAVTADATVYAKWTEDQSGGSGGGDTPVVTGNVTGIVTKGGVPQSGVTVKLMQGSSVIVSAVTDTDGKYGFDAADGTYNLVAEAKKDGVTKTALVTVSGDSFQLDIEMPTQVSSELDVTGDSTPAVMAGNLDEEAQSISTAEGGAPVTVKMAVEEKTEAQADGAASLIAIAPDNSTLTYLDISVTKTVNGATTELTETRNVLEIIVPYSFKGKENIAVYRYHDGKAEKLVEADTKANGTFRLDETNGFIYIYASEFSTYAIGYTQCYRVSGSVRYGKFSGEVSVLLRTEAGDEVAKYTDTMSNGTLLYSFSSIPQGRYNLIVTWKEKESNVLLIRPVNVHAGKVF